MIFEKERINILIIDNLPSNLQFISNILTKEGYKVQGAVSGEMAVNANFTVLPDLILLDIAMPTMNGYEVCERLKGNEKTVPDASTAFDVRKYFVAALEQS